MIDKVGAFNETLQAAAGATGNGTAMDVGGLAVVALQVTGTFVGTVTIEGSVDGTNYVAIRSLNVATGGVITTAAAELVAQVPVAGLSTLRARVSAFTSGAITVIGKGVTSSPGMALVT